MMQSQPTSGATWHPIVPSHYLRVSDNIVAGFAQGQELAIWRNKEGAVQVWDNRCPHRGTRLTLGRIIDDRLSCAYHGWEFGANGGKCTVIPAHPNAPAPKQLCVKTFSAAEVDGMVWVSLAEPSPPPSAQDGADSSTARLFVRTLGVRATLAETKLVLEATGLVATSSYVFQGQLAGHDVTVFLTEASNELLFTHVWQDGPDEASLPMVFKAAEKLRTVIEAQTPQRS